MNTMLDTESQALAIRLMTEDIEKQNATFRGKARIDEPVTDDQLVWDLQLLELDVASGILSDYHIAQELHRALETDVNLARTLENLEEFERQDRATALALEQGHELPEDGLRIPSPPPSEHTVHTDSTAAEEIEREDGAEFRRGSSSRTREVVCAACGDTIRGQHITAPCGDSYDRHCLNDLYEAIANGDQSLFPARCCRQEIPFDIAREVLSAKVIERYATKAEEFAVLNQLFCSNPACSKFLGPASEHEKGSRTCEACETVTCTLCKQCDHPSFVPCQNDLESEALLTLGREEGWQRCPGCHRMVELDYGCYHMTCLCRTQFCYVCAVVWKNCDCPQWEVNRLIRAAEDQIRVQHNIAPDRELNVRQQQAVQFRVEELRVNHDCGHPHWRLRHGRARCENCHHMLDRYLLRCVECQMMVCVRCQRNRL